MEKLLIISHTPHYLSQDRIVGWAATVKEIDALSTLFDHVVHIAPLHMNEIPPASTSHYESSKIQLKPVSPSGGDNMKDKLRILGHLPEYLKAIREEVRTASVIHIRCPANISLFAIILLAFMRQPSIRWIKYAGNWKPEGQEPWSYRFQRWFLRRGFHHGYVTVNGKWPGQPEFIHSFPNPCLTAEELVGGKEIASQKQFSDPVQLLYVGRLEEAKGVGRCLEILSILIKNNVSAHLKIVGDGPQRKFFESMAQSLKIDEFVHFYGWLPRTKLPELYSKGHIFIFPSSSSEGWPKVLSEAMAYGMVPIASRISSIPQILEMFECGAVLNPYDIEGFADAVVRYRNNPEIWRQHSRKGVNVASLFSYEAYLKKVTDLLQLNPDRLKNSEIAVRTT